MADRHLVLVPPERIAAVFSSQRLYSPEQRDTAPADDIKWDGLTLVGAYYDCVFATLDCPTAGAFWDHYINEHDDQARAYDETVTTAMKWRALRFYNSQVLEHQLMGYMAGLGMFRSVSKSEALDTSSGVDIVIVLQDGKEVGLQLSSPSRMGAQYGNKKARRQQQRDANGESTWNGPVVNATYDYKMMAKIPAYRPSGEPCKLSVFTAATARAMANHVYSQTKLPVPPPLSKDLPAQYRLSPPPPPNARGSYGEGHGCDK